ncbi:MAG: hypothetical protein PVJ87_10755, partial [Desulfobacterales bacterium]
PKGNKSSNMPKSKFTIPSIIKSILFIALIGHVLLHIAFSSMFYIKNINCLKISIGGVLVTTS